MSSLSAILSAAAPLGLDVEAAVKKRMSGICVKQGWGMSELSPLGLLNSDFNTKPGSVGPLVPNTYGKIVGEDGKSLPPNQPGELLIKGPQVMMGYLDDVDKTTECLSHSGWLRTGGECGSAAVTTRSSTDGLILYYVYCMFGALIIIISGLLPKMSPTMTRMVTFS